MVGGEQKLARGSTDALVPRDVLAYVTSAALVTTYTFTGRIRHLMVTTDEQNAITVTLPPVMEVAGQIYSVYLDVDGGADVTVTDAGDDADFTDVTLDDADDFCVIMSIGVRWVFLNKEEVA